jgi:hypothetical protein
MDRGNCVSMQWDHQRFLVAQLGQGNIDMHPLCRSELWRSSVILVSKCGAIGL